MTKVSSDSSSLVFQLSPGGSLRGRIQPPGDKSISHRALMFGALAEGETRVEGFLEGEDTLATLAAFQAMGVEIERPAAHELVIQGVGLHGLRAPGEALYLGNSGTSMRLLAGLLSGQGFDTVLTGDGSLSRRPMGRVIEPLAKMGTLIHCNDAGTPPLNIQGGRALTGFRHHLSVASAQVKSCLLLAGLYAKGETSVHEPAVTRDHTERMLQAFGYAVEVADGRISLQGGGRLQGGALQVPADISSAAFFLVGAAISPGSELLIENVGVNPTRLGVLHILRMMGAEIELRNPREFGREPVADLYVKASVLHGIRIPLEQVSLAIDEFPIIFIAAACAEGETVLEGAEELRVKESDRIAVMAEGLTQLGIAARPTADGMVIQGGAFSGGRVHSHGDHRIAMAFAMAALVAKGPITIDDCDNVATSFPGFVALASMAGLRLEAEQSTHP